MFAFGGFGGNAVNNGAAPPPLPLPRSQQPAAAPFNAVLGSLPPGPGNGGGGVLPSPGGFGGAFPSHPPHHHQHRAFPMSGAPAPLHPAPILSHTAPGSTAGAVPLSTTPVFGGPPPSSAPVLSQSGGRAAGGVGGGGEGVLGGAEAEALRSAAAGQRPPPPPRGQRAAAPPAKSSGSDVADRGGSAASHLSNARPVFGAPAPPGGGGGAEARPWLGASTTSTTPPAASPAPTLFAATATPSVFGSVDKKNGGSGAGPSAGAAGGSGILGSAFGTRTGAASGSAISAHAPPPAAAPSVVPSSSSVSSVFGASAPVSSATPAAAAPPPPPPSSTSSVFGAAALPSSSASAPPPAAVFGTPEPHSRSHNHHNDSSSSTPATSGVFSSALGATTASASPISSAFGSPSPKPMATAASQPPPPAATPSTSTGSNPFKPAFAPVAAAAPTPSTSVFGLGATPTTSFTSAITSTAPSGPSGSVFASPARPAPPPPAKSSFGPSVPAAKGAAVSSVFPAAASGGSAATAGRRRGRSPPQQQQHHDVRAPPAQTTRVEPSVAQPTQQQQQQQRQQQQRQKALQRQQPGRPLRTINPSERLPIPSLPPDEKRICLAARVCKSFLLQLASASALGGGAVAADHSRDEDVARALEQAYFGVVGTEGVHGDFSRTAGEMLALWQGQVRPMLPASAAAAFPAELWVALFGLGTYLNTITATVTAAAKAGGGGGGGGGSSSAVPSAGSALSTGKDLAAYKAGIRADPVAALTDACHYANELSELLQTLFQRGDDTNAPPYSIIPVVLRRVRSVFDEATARGVATVQSNLNAVTSKLFAVLNRRVKTSAVQPLNSPGAPARWLLTFDSTEKESLLHAFAYLIIEMIAADAPMSDDVELFTAAFHECFPAALAERCMLYYRRACALLRHSLSMPVVEEAAALLAKALAVYPPAAPPHNRRVLQVKLIAAEAALGQLPRDDAEWRALGVPQLIDIVNALKTARLDLLDVALKVHGAFYVEAGVHNVLCLARQRLALLMVVKYYLTHGCESRLSVQEMVRYHRLPYTTADAGMVWLLPLLMEKHMNGVLDHDFLILSGKSPFDAYPHPDLTTAAAALATR